MADTAAYSRENGWKSSSEFIMAAIDFIHKFNLDLHGELPQGCQTDVAFLTQAMSIVANKLNEFPDKADLIKHVNKLTADLTSMQTDRDKALKANQSWKNAYDSLKAKKQDALDELERQKQAALDEMAKQKQEAMDELGKQKLEVSRLTGLTNNQDEKLQSITDKVNDTLQQIEGENSFLGRIGMDGKKLAIALETLRWVASETSKPP